MNIHIPLQYVKELHDNIPDNFDENDTKLATKLWSEHVSSYTKHDVKDGQTQHFADKHLTLNIAQYFSDKCAGQGKGHRLSKPSIDTYIAITQNPTGAVITSLEGIVDAMLAYMKQAKHQYVFKAMGEDGQLCPFVFSTCSFTRAYENSPRHVNLSFSAVRVNSEIATSATLYDSNVRRGLTAKDILTSLNLVLETDELYTEYFNNMLKTRSVQKEIGIQYTATGFGEAADDRRWSNNAIVPMTVDGYPAKLVVDEHKYTTKTVKNLLYDEDDNNSTSMLHVPQHPMLYTFALDLHRYVAVHINDVTKYVYDDTLIDKLVLDDMSKGLVQILTTSDGSLIEDIVAGKTGGIFVIAEGKPGLGKTLTAEVASEYAKAPLYKVQCSQLGIDIDKIETKLREILERSVKWGAILLIDEADVYIRRRGNDIQQNAIVGVFLRLIEYYRGILFMTTNLGDDVDDAIQSRATVTITYQYPTVEERAAIWQILSAQYNITWRSAVALVQRPYDVLAAKFENISGRDIKNICKLIKLVHKDDTKVDIDSIDKYVKYVVKGYNKQ